MALSVIDMATHWMELVAVPNKTAVVTARSFDRVWLNRYPRPTTCIHDGGPEFTGIEFQEMLQSYGIVSSPITTANPQANAVLERTHQVIANQLRSKELMSVDITTTEDIQQELLAPVQWAINSTYHTTIRASPGQLAFQCDMVMPVFFMANWATLRQRRQHQTDVDNARENEKRIDHHYRNGDKVLIRRDLANLGKLAKPTIAPFVVVDASHAPINGTVVISRDNTEERINIRRLLPYTEKN